MEQLKKFFPMSWKYSKDAANLVVGILIYLILGVVFGALIGLATMISVWLPLVGGIVAWLLGIISSIAEIYVLVGILIMVLIFCKVIE